MLTYRLYTLLFLTMFVLVVAFDVVGKDLNFINGAYLAGCLFLAGISEWQIYRLKRGLPEI